MKKKLLLIITIVFFVALLALVIYWNPPTTPISISLDAVKVNSEGTIKKTVPIELTGKWIHSWFGDDLLDITSTEFDNLTRLELFHDGSSKNVGAVPLPMPNEPYSMCTGWAFNRSRNEPTTCMVLFSPDYERWLLAFTQEDVFYIGSVNEDDTPEVLYEYFEAFIQKNKS